jgi:serine/threonine protein kinase
VFAALSPTVISYLISTCCTVNFGFSPGLPFFGFIHQLGEGAFSVVKEGSHRQSNQSFAIKIVTKSKLSKEDEIALKDEIAVLTELKHKHIIRLYDVFDEPQYYYLVTEKMMGGELFDRIVQKSYYNEKEARDVCKILFDAMRFCHQHKIAHRDLKPENLLLTVSRQ